MKNSVLCLGLISFLMMTSCGKKEEKTTDVTNTTETTVDKTVVVDTVAVKKTDGTSVKVGSNGVSVDSKDVNVEIKK